MGKKIPLSIAVSAAVITAAVTVSLTYVYAMDKFNSKVADVNARQAMYTKLSEIDQKARNDYIGKINESALTDGICAGYVAGLGDSQAKYLSAEKYKEYLSANGSKSVGVGVETVQDDDGNMEVIEVMPNSPAEKAGIKKGDTIISMDGKEIARITYGDALNKLDGTAGTKVKLGILRKSGGTNSELSSDEKIKNTEIVVTRAEYIENTLTYSMINGNAAYIKISEFTDDTPDKFTSALSALMKKSAVGIVIDLRSNSGGSVKAAADVLDTLLPAGNTVSYKDKNGKTTVQYTSNPNEINLPISVVVDKKTFGAAEIFASDVKDFKKGLLVGQKTAGYGTKNQAVPLSDGSAVILSVANYLTVSGKTFTGGIGVDISKTLDTEQKALFVKHQLSAANDPQLQAAVAALIRQGAAVRQTPGTAAADEED